MHFFIGLHQPADAKHFDMCFVSVNRLRTRKGPFAVKQWIMDSGAYTEVSLYGGYRTSVTEYAALICKWKSNGELLAAVAQDYPAEAHNLAKTGGTVEDHQRWTIERYDDLIAADTGVYILPALQGQTAAQYADHVRQYGARLQPGAWVGVGGICKRQGKPQDIIEVLRAILAVRPDLLLHGFGVKTTALRSPEIAEMLTTADSMAWSFHARKNGRNGNSWREADAWRRKILNVNHGVLQA